MVPHPIRTLVDALNRNAEQLAAGRALLLSEESDAFQTADSVTWAELGRWVKAVAALLRSSYPHQGPLMHVVRNTPADVVIALACQAAGIIEIPVDVDGGADYLASCRRKIDGEWLDDPAKQELVRRGYESVHRAPGPSVVAELPQVSPTEDALVLWTSGTSGDPKGVVLSHASQLLNAAAKLRSVPQAKTDLRLTVLSIAHGYARTCDLGTWLLSGCTLAIARGFEGWQCVCQRRAPTLCNLVPSLAGRVLESGTVPPSLRLVGCGGAAMTEDQFWRWGERGVTVIQGYGLTEAGPVIASQTPDDSIPGHAGRFVDGWEHRLDEEPVGERGPNEAKPAEGRLFVRGPHLMRGYWQDPEATARRIDAAGWLDTGDRVRICPSTRQLQILGRCDDRIVLSNGHKIDPLGLEQRLVAIKGVRTAVVSAGAERRSVEFWVETTESTLPMPEIDAIVRTLPRWEQPKRIRRLEFPENLRQQLLNRKGAIRRSEMLRYLERSTGSC
ncbi:acyl--CoA ligase [Stieleria sp. ICT_E10.1]|uniref:class I adenylate-forming enzyme family protein n=1 Tax=Stieleria sedimenti TaxID=2976331 RepID=UPI00218045D2|nr:class I adenylate-forming enzyme family protein [Stieleria sedimenti]MCS7471010.1 acyl--CoA ligase [Stieleria sedimenti]